MTFIKKKNGRKFYFIFSADDASMLVSHLRELGSFPAVKIGTKLGKVKSNKKKHCPPPPSLMKLWLSALKHTLRPPTTRSMLWGSCIHFFFIGQTCLTLAKPPLFLGKGSTLQSTSKLPKYMYSTRCTQIWITWRWGLTTATSGSKLSMARPILLWQDAA